MTPDLESIQTIRRLIRAKRYEEAYALLKQTIHPQVPALEAKLQELMAANDQETRPVRRIDGWAMVMGFFIGAVFAFIVYIVGVQSFAILGICFSIGFALGIIVPEHIRQHPDHSEYFIAQKRKHNRKTWRW